MVERYKTKGIVRWLGNRSGAQLRLTRVHCHPAVSATARSVRPYAGTVYACAVWRPRQDRVEAWLGPAARRLRDGGRIVNFSSSVTSLLQSRAAVEAMTSILAKELGGRKHHRQRYRARADGDQALPPRRQVAGGDRAPLPNWRRWNGSASRTISPMRWPSSQARTGAWINGQVLRANGGMV